MQLDETSVCWPIKLGIDDGGLGVTLDLTSLDGEEITLCRKQAQQLLPILEHFIKTGELPDAN